MASAIIMTCDACCRSGRGRILPKYRIKRLLKWLVCLLPVNRIIRLLKQPLRTILSDANVARIPIVGAIDIRTRAAGHFVMVNDGDDRIASAVYWLGLDRYESETLSLFCKLAQRSRIVLDIGANSGVFALTAMASNPDADVYAFEPVPSIYNCLRRNAERNDSRRLRTYNLAVTDVNGEMPMYIPRDFQTFPLTSSLAPQFRDNCDTITVTCITLDTFAAEHSLGKIDLIKADTESTEHLVFAGGINTIKSSTPLIICEVNPEANSARLHQLLDPLGYKYFWITDHGLIPKDHIIADPTLKNSNYLFVPENRLPEIPNLYK